MRGEQDSERGPQRLRPLFGRAQGRAAPFESADELSHLAAPAQKVGRSIHANDWARYSHLKGAAFSARRST